jgi:hypothetical protein
MGTITFVDVIPFILGAVGLFIIIKYFRDRAKLQASENWSKTTGTVTKSSVRETRSNDSDGFSESSYYPEVKYSYQVIGQVYEGNRIAFGAESGHKRKDGALSVLEKYAEGKSVTVYYDPNRPEDSVLERKLSKTILVIGIVILVVSTLVVVFRAL